jgi:hypothetical protein
MPNKTMIPTLETLQSLDASEPKVAALQAAYHEKEKENEENLTEMQKLLKKNDRIDNGLKTILSGAQKAYEKVGALHATPAPDATTAPAATATSSNFLEYLNNLKPLQVPPTPNDPTPPSPEEDGSGVRTEETDPLKAISAAHDESEKKKQDIWQNVFNALTAEKENLYKADPRMAQIKQNEAKLKTLVSAFGSLADTFAAARGGTVEKRDNRNEVNQANRQADELNQREQQRERQEYQLWLNRYLDHRAKEPVPGINPAHTLQHSANLTKAKIDADAERQAQKQENDNEQKQLDRDLKKEISNNTNATRVKIAGGSGNTQKPYTNIYIDLGDGAGKKSIPLDAGQLAYLANKIIEKKGWNDTNRNNADFKMLKYSLGEGNFSTQALNLITAKYADLIRDDVKEIVSSSAPAAAPTVETGSSTSSVDVVSSEEIAKAIADAIVIK